MTTLPDAGTRLRAATDFETNLVVLAGAGTGKTSLVVERLLNALGVGRVELDGLAAITFTEKAAGEMRERLASGLDRLRGLARGEFDGKLDTDHEADRAFQYLTSAGGQTEDRIAERALAAMEQLDRATVTTIHGFCSELLRRHPVEARVDPDFAVDTGEHAVTLGHHAWDAFVVEELGPEAEREELWAGLLEHLPLSMLRDVALELAGFGVPERCLQAPFEGADARVILGPTLNSLTSGVDALLERETGLTDMARSYFENVQRVLTALRDGGLDSFQEALEASGDLASRVEKGNNPKAGKKIVEPETMNALSKESTRLIRALGRVDQALFSQVVEAVAPFALAFREDFLRRGLVSFDGLLSLARDLLRDSPDVRRSLALRYKMILIDEFQDTDPVQHEIALFLGGHPEERAADPYAAALEPGRLFVVGDAKQSIYRFRGADYAAYRRAVERIVEAGGVELDLVANFRSVPGIVDAVNQLFEASDGAWAASDYQPDYTPIRAVRPPGADPAVEVWTVNIPEGSNAETRREAEGRLLAQSIRRLVVEQQACAYRDITILFRAFTSISHYLRPLREYGIPFVVDGGKDFLLRPEVAQLMAILRTLSQPADAPALLAFLRGPAGGVSDVELADFKESKGRFDWRHAPPEPAGRIGTCFELLRQLAKETQHLPADATVRRVVERMQLLPLGAAAFEGPQRVANLSKLAAAAGELARDGRLSLEEVVEALREGRLIDIQSDRPLSDDAAEAVRITSIHRMKGLENDWVFLPDIARPDSAGRSDGRPVCVARPPDSPPALAISANGTQDTARVWLDAEGREHEQAEETRVFYVALTRAKKQLVLLASPPKQKSPWIEALRPWGYEVKNPPEDGALIAGGGVLHRKPTLRPLAVDAVEMTGDGIDDAVGAYAQAVERLRAAARPPLAAPSQHDEDPSASRSPAPTQRTTTSDIRGTDARELGRALGIVVHRVLEKWPADGDRATVETLAATLVQATAQAEGVAVAKLKQETTQLLDGFLASPLAAELGRIDIIGREVPMLLSSDDDGDGQVYRGNIDMLYRADDGAWVVADFKTDRNTDETTLKERYRHQLATYASAVTAALNPPVPVRTELWILRSATRLPL